MVGGPDGREDGWDMALDYGISELGFEQKEQMYPSPERGREVAETQRHTRKET